MAGPGMSRNTVIKAKAEVAAGIKPPFRLRALGGKPSTDRQLGLLETLDELLHPAAKGSSADRAGSRQKPSKALASANGE
jgi:hypothetical protein